MAEAKPRQSEVEHDDDRTWLMWYDEAGNAVDATELSDARKRLVAHFSTPTAALGWAENQAEKVLRAIFEDPS